MKVIAYTTELDSSRLVITESPDAKCSTSNPDTMLTFFLEPYENSIKVCWDLNATVARLLRFIGKLNCTKLYQNKKCYIPPYELFYIPDKVFSIRHIPTKVTCYLYGLDQYFPDDIPPSNAQEIQWLGEYLLAELSKMGLEPTKLTSPVAIYEQCIMQNFRVPTVQDMPRKAAEYALRCSGKLWIEAYQLGCWDSCFDYDIVNSFPNVAKDMLDFRYGRWQQYNGYYLGNSEYQYCKCKVFIRAEVSPIIHVINSDSCTPVGSWETYLTQQEISFIEYYNIGTVEVLSSWSWIPEKEVKPIEKPLEKLLSYRQKSKLQNLLAKRIAVGLYGKFGEERTHELGPYFNPCWFAEISTRVRLQVAKFIYDNHLQDSLLHVSVDGLLADKLVDIPIGWQAEELQALIFSSGLVYTHDKKPQGLNLSDVLAMIEDNPRQGHYQRQIQRTACLGDVIERGTWAELGLEVPMYTSLDFYKVQHDRDFPIHPQNGQQLLNKHFKSKARKV